MKFPFLSEMQIKNILKHHNLDTPLTLKALEQVTKSHKGQKRDDGQPYLEEHIYPVVSEIIDSFQGKTIPEEIIIAGFLHDAMEDDSKFTLSFCEKTFPKKFCQIIAYLTKSEKDNRSDHGQQEKMEINKKVIIKLKKVSKEAKIIKLADRYNNLSCIILIKDTMPEKYQRYLRETEKYFLPFAKENSKYFYQKMKSKIKELKSLG